METFGACLAHLTAMTEDSGMQPADRQRMKEYVIKWQSSQIMFGCALFHDILRSLSTLRKASEEGYLCCWAVECFLKTQNSLEA